jgi:hypothetical protein
MIQYVTKEMFHATFNKIRPNQFSDPGLDALFHYLDDFEEDRKLNSIYIEEEDYVLDVIVLCSEYTEFTNVEEALESYGYDYLEELIDNHVIIYLEDSDGIIVDL